MIDEIRKLLDDYAAWLRDRTFLRDLKDVVEITTPYLDWHNDYIQIYAKRVNGNFLLTDDGYTITDLEQSGCKLESRKRQHLLRMTLNGFGVQLHDDALQVHASRDNFAGRKHNLAQSILAVNDLFYLAAPTVASLFFEDVVAWLDLNGSSKRSTVPAGTLHRRSSCRGWTHAMSGRPTPGPSRCSMTPISRCPRQSSMR